MKDKLHRRDFLTVAGATVATTSLLVADEIALDPRVEAELKNRMKFLSPPDGIASDLEVRPSPNVTPFATEFFRPTIARPLINLTDKTLWVVNTTSDGNAASVNLHPDDFKGENVLGHQSFINDWIARLIRENLIAKDDSKELQLADKAWLIVFYNAFRELSDRLLKQGLDIGGFPLPQAHQRFFDFKPMKFYAIWEMEFPWKFSDQDCPATTDRHGRQLKCANWTKGSWSWGFAQLLDDQQGQQPINASARTRPQHVELSQATFEAMSPGPTFKAKYDEPILVRRINRLPEILNDDHTWTSGNGTPRRHIKFALPSTTTHLHNAHTASESDGNPNDWINPGEYWDHHYGNFPSGYDNREKLTTLWYHDHRMDFTASNVYAGLDGFYFLFDEQAQLESDETHCDIDQELCLITQSGDLNDEENGWRLPAKEYDIPLIFHDLLFDQDENGDAQLVFDGFNTDGILGDRYTANRVIQPRLSVKRRKYRFRLLVGGPSRFCEFFLHTNNPDEFFDSQGNLSVENSAKEATPFIAIAGDGNFQPNPVLVRSIFVGVAQRNDVIIDFSSFGPEVKHVYLVNRLQQINGRGPSGRRNSPLNNSTDEIQAFLDEFSVVRFDLEDGTVDDPSRIPLQLREFPPVDLTEVRRERTWNFDYDGGLWTINGLTYEPNRIDAGIEQDSAEIWTFRNAGNSWSHPIHSHFTEFIVLEINGVPQYQSTIQTTDAPRRGGGRTIFPNLKEFQNKFKALKPAQRTQLMEGVKKYSLEKDENKLRDIRSNLQTQNVQEPFEGYLEFSRSAARQQETGSLTEETTQQLRTVDFMHIGLKTLAEFETVVLVLAALGAQLDLRKIDNREQGNGVFMGGHRRDVALIMPNWEVKVFMRWKDFLGKHVMHCHNVVHEDHAMMIRWDIVQPGHGFDTPKYTHEVYGDDEGIPHVQPTPGHSLSHPNDSDSPRGR